MRPITRIAPDVGWLSISFANVYFIGRPGGGWLMIDTAFPGCASQILEAAEARFGADAPPEAIVLTHGHYDHAGSALELAEKWDVPVYVHRLEFPYLTGRSSYPPTGIRQSVERRRFCRASCHRVCVTLVHDYAN